MTMFVFHNLALNMVLEIQVKCGSTARRAVDRFHDRRWDRGRRALQPWIWARAHVGPQRGVPRILVPSFGSVESRGVASRRIATIHVYVFWHSLSRRASLVPRRVCAYSLCCARVAFSRSVPRSFVPWIRSTRDAASCDVAIVLRSGRRCSRRANRFTRATTRVRKPPSPSAPLVVRSWRGRIDALVRALSEAFSSVRVRSIARD